MSTTTAADPSSPSAGPGPLARATAPGPTGGALTDGGGPPAREDFRSIPEMLDRVVDVAVEKADRPVSTAVRALVGGAMVAFGVLLSLVVSTGQTVAGMSSLVTGLAFGFSLVLILVSGASLVTADMAAGIVAVLHRRLSWAAYVRFLLVSLVGNLVGVVVFVAIAAAAGGPYLAPGFVQHAVAVGTAKASTDGTASVLLAVLCTWFLQTAMFMFFKARSDVARMGFAFYGPFAFVAAGTQHVIANAGFIGLPLLLGVFHSGVHTGALAWGFGGAGLMRNIVLTTIGNFVGGTLFVAVPFQILGRQAGRGVGPVGPGPVEAAGPRRG